MQPAVRSRGIISLSASQEIPRRLKETMMYNCVHNGPLLAPTEV
jgi:hypothetical protein